MTEDEIEIYNQAIEDAAHVPDMEHLRLHSLAASAEGDRQKELEADARYAGLIASLIREKKR